MKGRILEKLGLCIIYYMVLSYLFLVKTTTVPFYSFSADLSSFFMIKTVWLALKKKAVYDEVRLICFVKQIYILNFTSLAKL